MMPFNPLRAVVALSKTCRGWRGGLWAACLVALVAGVPGMGWAEADSAAQEPAVREIYEAVIERARRQISDYIIQQTGESDNPATQAKVISEILGRIKMIGHSTGDSSFIVYYDEIDRHFGDTRSPEVRVLVMEALIRKGNLLKVSKAITVFNEIEQRFGGDEHPAVRAQYVRSLIEKGAAWAEDDPKAELEAYDAIVLRFGNDKLPGVRAQAAAALLRKAEALGRTVPERTTDALLARIRKHFAAHLQKCQLNEAGMLFDRNGSLYDLNEAGLLFDTNASAYVQQASAEAILRECKIPDIQDVVAFFSKYDPSLSMSPRNCQALDTRYLLATYDEIEQQFEKNGDFHMWRVATKALFSECHQPDIQKVAAVYDDIERRFGEDEDSNVQWNVVLALLKKSESRRQESGEIVWKAVMEADLALYEKINRRYGQNNVAVRETIASRLADTNLYTQLLQWFGEDKHPNIQGEVIRGLFAKGESLSKAGDTKAAVAIYDDVIRRFEADSFIPKVIDIICVMRQKGYALQQNGDLEAAIAVYDEIGQHPYAIYDDLAISALVRKGKILEAQGKLEEAIAFYDDIERRFQGNGWLPTLIKARASAIARLPGNEPDSLLTPQ
jgi:tetratricopeptide (TPR) repeat protein